jgi:heme exporter protein D
MANGTDPSQFDLTLEGSTSVGAWRSFTSTLARTVPMAVTSSAKYRRAALRQIARKRRVHR